MDFLHSTSKPFCFVLDFFRFEKPIFETKSPHNEKRSSDPRLRSLPPSWKICSLVSPRSSWLGRDKHLPRFCLRFFQGFPMGFLRFSKVFLGFSKVFSGFLRFFSGFPMGFLGFSKGFSRVFYGFLWFFVQSFFWLLFLTLLNCLSLRFFVSFWGFWKANASLLFGKST